MTQTMLLKEESPLFDTAISKLRPGVFSHPVWIKFGNREEPIPAKTVGALLEEAEKIKQYSPGDACQVLLICAVFQNYSGEAENALKTIQEILRIAQKNGLDREILWALWGACAICIQHKSFDKAVTYLTSLKHSLNDQNDWMLAGFIDVVKQILRQNANTNNILQLEYHQNQSMGNVLAYTFHWLNHWGFSAQSGRQDSFTSENPNQALPASTFKGLRSLRLLLRGELKINWLEEAPRQAMKRSSFWGYILSLFHVDIKSLEQVNMPEIISSTNIPDETVVAHPPEEVMPVIVQERIPSQEVAREIPLSISVQMLGNFNLTIQETQLNLPSSRSLSLFKYLLLNHRQNTPREVLLDIFWPDLSMERGRNNLNVAMNGIRTSLRTITDTPVILYKDNAYGIAPETQFWVDVEEFERLVDSGRRLESRNRLSSAISEYEAAVSLYQGDLLEESPYENWTVLPRERLRLAYLTTLDRLSHIYYNQERYAMCITFSQLILARDRCREDAHAMLMRCYSRQGQDHLALRQYQACVEALRLELDVTPAPETAKLYEQIRQHKYV